MTGILAEVSKSKPRCPHCGRPCFAFTNGLRCKRKGTR
jgi:hypothetical protein